MTSEQRQARAMQKASGERAHVLSVQGRPGFYVVKSATDAAVRYIVNTNGGQVQCSCRAASYGHDCWHAERVKARLIREAKRPAAVVSSAAKARELLYA